MGSDSLGGHIDSPLIILDLSRFIELESTVIDTASQFIIAAGFNINVSVLVGSILGVVLASAIMSILIAVGIAILLSLASSLLVSLVLLVRLWLILKDETAEIDNDGLNTVSFAFDLRLELLHLVAVEGIFHIASDIDGSHDCDLLGVPLASLCVLFRVELGPLDDRTMRH